MHTADKNGEIGALLETSLGCIEVVLYLHRAPVSARAFLALLDDPTFARQGSFYRAVRQGENDGHRSPIDIIQGGLLHPVASLRPIVHETTASTGIRHLDGTISLTRRPDEIGTATGAGFFICIGAQPALDAGGGRAGDGQGFAAFGRVAHGMDVVRRIHNLRTALISDNAGGSGQVLDPPVPIVRACLK